MSLAEHFRFIHIAVAAYRITGEERYLDWSLRYGRKRAERIIAAESPMPLLWDLDGNGVGEAEVEEKNLHRIAAHSTHHLSSDPLAGIENLLASGAIYALGDLYHLSGETAFKDAAKRIVEPLVESVLDPYHDPAAAAISYYRRTFEDTTFDQTHSRSIGRLAAHTTTPCAHLSAGGPATGIGRRSASRYGVLG